MSCYRIISVSASVAGASQPVAPQPCRRGPAEERESAPQPEVLGSAHGLQPHRPVIMAERTVVSAAGVLSPRVAGSWQLASPPPVALRLCSANIFVQLQRDQHRWRKTARGVPRVAVVANGALSNTRTPKRSASFWQAQVLQSPPTVRWRATSYALQGRSA